MALFFPLQGFWNALIYVRPRIVGWKQRRDRKRHQQHQVQDNPQQGGNPHRAEHVANHEGNAPEEGKREQESSFTNNLTSDPPDADRDGDAATNSIEADTNDNKPSVDGDIGMDLDI